MGLIISSPLLLNKVLSLNITLDWLFVFLSYNLVGYRFVFTLYSFLFLSRISRNFVFEFIVFNRVEFSFFIALSSFFFAFCRLSFSSYFVAPFRFSCFDSL